MRGLVGICSVLGIAVAVFCMAASSVLARDREPDTGPAVVVSIAPIHSLVTMVMDGVATPRLLLPQGASPHAYALRPSDARALARARLVIWVGPSLEGFLEKPLASLVARGEIMGLMAAPGLILHQVRRGGAWPGHSSSDSPSPAKSEHGDHGHGHPGDAGGFDPHIWLDPRNGVAMVRAITGALARLDPANAPRYRDNARRAEVRLGSLDRTLAARLGPIRERPYVVFHDAYRYFEARYGLKAVGSIVVDTDRRPGIKRLKEIRARIRETGAACVLAEPQFSPRVAATVVEGSGARIGVLDPLGAKLAPGPGLYFSLLNSLADDLIGCLAGATRRR
jgi:zinc transport system substrate-binding protein